MQNVIVDMCPFSLSVHPLFDYQAIEIGTVYSEYTMLFAGKTSFPVQIGKIRINMFCL